MRTVIGKLEKFLAFIRVNKCEKINDAGDEKILGYTKSGRAVYEKYDNVKHKTFTSGDHYDALNYHKKILEKLARENGACDEIDFHRAQAMKHFLDSVS